MKGGDSVKGLRKTAYVLVIIGALNWGLIGFFNLNFVSALLGAMAGFEKIVYMLVGLSGLLMLTTWGKK